jgi:hypothetical protein
MQGQKNILKLITLFIFSISTAYADFKNGNFEDPISTPWISTGYLFTGYKTNLVLPPKSLNDITLTPTSNPSKGLIGRVNGATQTLYDYFLYGVSPDTKLLLPEEGNYSAMINLQSVNAPLSVSGTSAKPSGWKTYGKLATALSQTITIEPGDIDSNQQVHIRFKLAAVMENPAHTAKQQPFYAVQINNLTTGRKGSNPLFFQWSYAAQPGVPWNTINVKGTNSGSNVTYTYVDWQNFDVTLSSSEVKMDDEIELIVLAAGCSPGGHDGHIYLDSVTTQEPKTGSGLIIKADGPKQITAGQDITYTYTFTNYNSNSLSNVCVEAHMPQTQNTNPPQDTVYKNFDVGTSGMNCNYIPNENLLRCCSSNLTSNETKSFQMTVAVPQNWKPSDGPINNGNYPISATGFNPVLGNLVQTEILAAPPAPQDSYLHVDTTGLLINGQDPILKAGDYYHGTYTCANISPGTAPANPASCYIDNLPDGLSLTGCSKNGSILSAPYSININEVITCFVSGTIPANTPSREYITDISSNAKNNINGTTNQGTVPFFILNNPETIPATLNGQNVLSPTKVCCGRPVVLYDLPIENDVPATYEIISVTGSVQCSLGYDGIKNFVKVFGRPGSCTVIAIKDNQLSAPLIFQAN